MTILKKDADEYIGFKVLKKTFFRVFLSSKVKMFTFQN